MKYETIELIGKYEETIRLHDEGERTYIEIFGDNAVSTGNLEMKLNEAKQHMINQGCREIKTKPESKYNRREIFVRMWNLIKKHKMSKSAALKMAWSYAQKGERLSELENEKFLLEMKDLSGGRGNAAAQMQIAERDRELDRITREIEELRAAIYPTITVKETRNILSEKERASLIRRIANLEEMTAQAESSADEFYYWNQLTQAKHELEESVRTYTRTVVDLGAYEKIA